MSRYPAQTRKTTSPSQAIDDSKKKTSLLKDNSWIRRNNDEEEEDVDRDPNFGKSVLSRYKSSETLVSPDADQTKPTKTTNNSVSVHALTKRFGGSQDELRSSTLPPRKTPPSYTRSTHSSLKSPLPDSPKTTTPSKTTVTEEPKTSTTTTKVTKNGKTTETTITTTQSVRSPVSKSPTKTETFTERVKSSSKGSVYPTFSPSRTSKVTETTVTNSKDVEDKLYDTLIPSPVKDDFSPKDSKKTISTTETVIVKSSDDDAEDKLYDTLIPQSIKDDFFDSKTPVSSTKTVTVKSSTDGDGIKTTTTKRTSSTAEDDLYDTLLPKGITSSLSSPDSTRITKRETVTVDSSRGGESPTLTSPSSPRRTPSYEYSSINSPNVYTTTSYRSSSRSDDNLSSPIYSKPSVKSTYSTPERTVLEKDLCTICRKPFTGEAKMVLDDMKINCHASCFKCEVCNSTLGHMKAGDSMWIYKHMVHCEHCFEVTRDKWRR
ncbi:sciellin isoform X1 [Thunnus albacares]|uniref:sciellin isoform X1 n=1 Tax=Thunnus albacares TaxID=8236 RepID=UPI001CF6D95F|nr:sciellin isoform X1 [Thunnus albacares]